jgi:hypothetical protein
LIGSIFSDTTINGTLISGTHNAVSLEPTAIDNSLAIASTQTSGILNIGTGVRSAVINIGNTLGSTGGISIGATGSATTIIRCSRM